MAQNLLQIAYLPFGAKRPAVARPNSVANAPHDGLFGRLILINVNSQLETVSSTRSATAGLPSPTPAFPVFSWVYVRLLRNAIKHKGANVGSTTEN